MRIVAAISGGVDSAVAAARLVRAGADVIGVHLRTGVEADDAAAGGARSCCGADDARDARAVAARLRMPFYVVDVQEAFAGVIANFVDEYAAGRTPNPCVLCNQVVKFGRLLEIAHGLGADTVATGHYARCERAPGGRMRLLRAANAPKDQTYVLHALNQKQLAAARFPLGDTGRKALVREEAARLGFDVAAKPDSQDLCFVPAGGPRAFLKARAPACMQPGAFVDERETVLGRHDGAAAFTPGQRRGLPAVGEPRYVQHVDPIAGRVTIAPRDRLLERIVVARGLNWIECAEPREGARFDVEACIRHGASPQAAVLRVREGHTVEVTFAEPLFAPAPGQALVAYVGDAVLCGGTITAAPRRAAR